MPDRVRAPEGRAFVRGLEMKGQKGWVEWSKSGQRPSDIPGNPSVTYRDDGLVLVFCSSLA